MMGPLVESRKSASFCQILEIFFAINVANIFDFVKRAKCECLVFVNWRAKVLAVITVFYLLLGEGSFSTNPTWKIKLTSSCRTQET